MFSISKLHVAGSLFLDKKNVCSLPFRVQTTFIFSNLGRTKMLQDQQQQEKKIPL